MGRAALELYVRRIYRTHVVEDFSWVVDDNEGGKKETRGKHELIHVSFVSCLVIDGTELNRTVCFGCVCVMYSIFLKLFTRLQWTFCTAHCLEAPGRLFFFLFFYKLGSRPNT